MKNASNQRVREHYELLRSLDCDTLWNTHVAAFNGAPAARRLESVSVIRAVAVVFSTHATPVQKREARAWVRSLLEDPAEKIRRYAIQALPKLGAEEAEEKVLLGLWKNPSGDREQRVVNRTLERVGGQSTLEKTSSDNNAQARPAPDKLRANIARQSGAGALETKARLADFSGVRILLLCRSGLEDLVAGELAENPECRTCFEKVRTGPAAGRLEYAARKEFSLGQLLRLRCWSGMRFPLGQLPALDRAGAPLPLEALAHLAASPVAWKIMRAFTSGPIRYRWEFPARRVPESIARDLSQKVHTVRPELLNDPRAALWEICVEESPRGLFTTLRPKFRPDPRFAYRTGDVPAASHPPLASALARISQVGAPPFAGRERVWDPFCGSGLELAECALMDPSTHLYGTDLDPEACRVAAANVHSALDSTAPGSRGLLQCITGDFRDAPTLGIPRDGLTLLITNPPLGKRVPEKGLQELIQGLFSLAGRLLVPEGRLVLVNPCAPCSNHPTLRLVSTRRVDLGFAHFQLEKYVQTRPQKPAGGHAKILKQTPKTTRPRARFR